jgi:hypothetical protein
MPDRCVESRERPRRLSLRRAVTLRWPRREVDVGRGVRGMLPTSTRPGGRRFRAGRRRRPDDRLVAAGSANRLHEDESACRHEETGRQRPDHSPRRKFCHGRHPGSQPRQRPPERAVGRRANGPDVMPRRHLRHAPPQSVGRFRRLARSWIRGRKQRLNVFFHLATCAYVALPEASAGVTAPSPRTALAHRCSPSSLSRK